MQKTLASIAAGIDRLNEWAGRSVSWLTSLLVLLVCFDVITRYLLKDTATWIMELEWHLFALIFLIGAGYALKHDRHVRVDLFYARFSARDKALVNLVGGIVFLIPWCLLIVYTSFGYALDAWQTNEGSPDPGGLPARYVIKFSITMGMTLLLLQGVSQLIRSILTLLETKDPLRKPDTPSDL
ncbi:MAG: TRAP transporter small permease subunit [Bacteroidota bacterium]